MRRTTVLAVALAAAVSLTACGDDADTTDPSTTTETESTDSSTATEDDTATDSATAEAAATRAVTGVDYAFEGLPAEVDAGTTLEFTNASDAEVHELVLVRVPDDEVRSAGELLALPEEESQAMVGSGLVGVSVAMPGEDGRVVEGDLTVSQPGRYLALCFIQTGVDPEVYAEAAAESQGGPVEIEGGGAPHVANGMVTEFTVS